MYRKRVLFYPCAGADISSAIETFIGTVDSFWFVDDNAYQRRAPSRRAHWQPVTLDSTQVDGAEVKRFELTSTELGKTVEINFAAGDSRKVFASLVAPKTECDLAVFYYRGDSCGEGGSGICWLSEQCCDSIATGMLSTVLNALHLPGLIVTDGSNGHDGFRKFHNKMDAALNIHRHSDPFTAEGFRLKPIGTAGRRYGPTIIWQVNRDGQ